MTDEELIRRAYIEYQDPLVLELCSRIAKLIDENADFQETIKDIAGHIPH